MRRLGFNELIIGTVAAVTLGVSCSDTSSQTPSSNAQLSGEYPVGTVVHSMAELKIGECALKNNFSADGPLQELFQVRGEEDKVYGMIRMVYVFPVSKADRGNINAPHEFWFSGPRSEDLLGIKDGELSIIPCPPVDEPRTHSNGGGFVEEHTGETVFVPPTSSTPGP